MIKIGNFSGNAIEAYKQGEKAFKETQRGLFNGDLDTLWNEIVKLAEGDVKPPQNKVEKPTKTK